MTQEKAKALVDLLSTLSNDIALRVVFSYTGDDDTHGDEQGTKEKLVKLLMDLG